MIGVLVISIIISFVLHNNPVMWAFGRSGKVRLGEVGCLTQEVVKPLDKGEQSEGTQHFQGRWAGGTMSCLHVPGSIAD